MTERKRKARRSGGNRTSPQTTQPGNRKDSAASRAPISPQIRRAGDVLPSMRYQRDFWVFDNDGDLAIRFRRCPACGRECPHGEKAVLVDFDHPAVRNPITYAIDLECALKIANQRAWESEESNRVAKAVLGAVIELVRLSGGQEPTVIIGDAAQLAAGSKVPS